MKRFFREGIKMLLQNGIFPLIYNLNRRRPVRKGLIVFADAHHTDIPEHMSLLYEALQKKGVHVVKYCFDVSKLSPTDRLRRMTAFMKLYAVSEGVVLCNNFLPAASCRKRKETKVIQLWHAAGALKKFGYDAADDVPSWYKGNVYNNYDLVTVSGPEAVAPFKSAMRISGNNIVCPIGISEMDRLSDKNWLKARKDRFNKLYPEAEGRKIILWAPTFRGAAGDAKDVKVPGEREIDKLFGNDKYFVIKSLHPHQTSDIQNMTTEELMVCSDIVISDYSSLIYQAIYLKIPVVYFAPDLKEYENKRGFYSDYASLPGIHPKDEETLADAVERAVKIGSSLYDNAMTRDFTDKYLSGCDGKATDRILMKIIEA